MTGQAASCKIRDTFFIVFPGYFVFVMASKAIGIRSSRRMALAALPVGIAMIHREFMIERSPSPGGSGMAL
jgi:hypothetical protein